MATKVLTLHGTGLQVQQAIEAAQQRANELFDAYALSPDDVQVSTQTVFEGTTPLRQMGKWHHFITIVMNAP